MKRFTIETIRSFNPCYDPSKYLPEDWSGTVIDLLDRKDIPFQDRLWVICRNDFLSDKLMRLFAVWCARQVQHLTNDERSARAIDTAEAFAHGNATQEDLAAAWAAARDAAWDAAWAVARDAAWAVARDAAWAVARDAAWAAAWDAAWAVARAAARDAAWAVARDAAWAAARDAAWAAADAAWAVARAAARDAAWAVARAAADAAWDAQHAKLREMILIGVETGDVVLEEVRG
jgi:hypothetical protein